MWLRALPMRPMRPAKVRSVSPRVTAFTPANPLEAKSLKIFCATSARAIRRPYMLLRFVVFGQIVLSAAQLVAAKTLLQLARLKQET